MKITKSKLGTFLEIEQEDLLEFGLRKFCTEASDIGLGPNEWPDMLLIHDGAAFFHAFRDSTERDGGDIVKVIYRTPSGWEVVVFND